MFGYAGTKLERQKPSWNSTRPQSKRKQKKNLFSNTLTEKAGLKENLYPFPDAVGNVTTEDKEKAEVLNAIFTSAFKNQISYPWCAPSLDLEIFNGEQNKHPMIEVENC